MKPAPSRIRRVLRWTALALLLLVGAGFVLIMLPGWMYDTASLPPRHGQLQTELFVGNGERQPLLVGFGGGEGGNAWASDRWQPQRQRFLDRGYAFLAVGYFGMPGTPEHLDRIALDAIHAEIRRVAEDPRIDGSCIALIGGSKGAELALALAAHYPDIRAVIGLVPGHAVFAGLTPALTTSSFSVDGEPLPFVPVPWSAAPALIAGDHRTAFEAMLDDDDAVSRAAIAVERINGPLLLLSATRDEMWPSTTMAERIVHRLQAHDFAFSYQHLPIDGGHNAPLDRFDVVEAFLDTSFKAACAHDAAQVASMRAASVTPPASAQALEHPGNIDAGTR